MLLKDESKLLIFFWLLAGYLHLLFAGCNLLAKKQEIQITTAKEKKHGYDTDRYSGAHPRRRTAHLASQ